MIVYNRTHDKTVADKVEKARTFRSRLVGLISRRNLEPEEGLWIAPCRMIHTCFMRFPIDAVFLDKNMAVKRVVRNLKPWKLSPWVFGAHGVLELVSGRCQDRIKEGDVLEFSG